jgi:thiol-disulfide isomerase/thioredoxin
MIVSSVMKNKVTSHRISNWIIVLVAGMLVGLACRLPTAIGQLQQTTVTPPMPTTTPKELPARTATPGAATAQTSPQVITPTLGAPGETVSPGPGEATATSGGEMPYPSPGVQASPTTGLSPTTPSSPNPGAYPGPGGAYPGGYPFPPPGDAYPGAYPTPFPVSVPTFILPTTVSTPGTAVPAQPAVQAVTPSPSLSATQAALTLTPTHFSTAASGSAQATVTSTQPSGTTTTPTPTATASSVPTLIPSMTPTLPLAAPTASPTFPVATFTPTTTPSPTLTPFYTSTPTPTSTPTLTPTPLPPPPWISAQLRATDPRTVLLASGRVQLVEFFAFWNGPSQALASTIQGLEHEYQGKARFIYLDVDDPATETFQRQLGFRIEPQFFLLDEQGRVLNQWTGYVTPLQLRQALDAALAP